MSDPQVCPDCFREFDLGHGCPPKRNVAEDLQEANEQKLLRIRKLEDLVRRQHEALDWFQWNLSCCFVCDGPERELGREAAEHKPDCPYAAVLAEGEEVLKGGDTT